MAISRLNRKRPAPSDTQHDGGVAPRRSFLKVLGGATLGAVAAVTGVGSRQSEVQATHSPGTFSGLHSGENPVDSVTLMNHDAPRETGQVIQPESRAVLEVGRGYYGQIDYRNVAEDDVSRPAIRGIRGDFGDSQFDDTSKSAAVVGHNMADGTGVLGSSMGGPGVRGEGYATGVHGIARSNESYGPDLSVGVRGSGNLGVLGTGGTVDEFSNNASGIGVVGLGRSDIAPSTDTLDHVADRIYLIDEHTEIVTNPDEDGIGVLAAGGTGVEGIADRDTGAGVLGANTAGGQGVVGHAPGGTGVIGVGAIGLRGVAIDDHGNVVGSGIIGEGPTGVTGISTNQDGAGVEGSSTTGDGIRGTGRTGVRGESEDEDGEGVLGNGKTGVRGRSDNENGAGVRGEGKAGVHGRATRAQGRGVVGEAEDDDDDGVAVEGIGKNGEGVRGNGRTGVRGKSEHAEGAGVRGEGKTGVHGRADQAQGKGIHGEADDDDGVGVQGNNGRGDAVRGEGKTGVRGKSGDADGTGVTGENEHGVGIEGRGRVGVRGVANGQGSDNPNAARHSLAATSATLLSTHLPEEPVAIQGIAVGPGSTGIQAGAEGGATAMKIETTTPDSVALSVTVPEGGTAVHIRGAACFDTVGAGQFPKNARSATVPDPRVTAESFIYTMLTGNPGQGNGTDMTAVQWVERSPGQGFTVHLNASVKQATPFSYFIVEPCPSDEEADHRHN